MRLFSGRHSVCRFEQRTTLTAFQLFFLGREWVIVAFQASAPGVSYARIHATMRPRAPSVRRDGFTLIATTEGYGDASQRWIKTAVTLPSGTQTHTVIL